jgi:hypothetical protein
VGTLTPVRNATRSAARLRARSMLASIWRRSLKVADNKVDLGEAPAMSAYLKVLQSRLSLSRGASDVPTGAGT